jgi:tetratricopeptide (TPR) repeat protein
MVATRSEARCYPHFNLGRVYEHQRKWEKARKCYAQAYAIDDKYVTALKAFRRLSAAFN